MKKFISKIIDKVLAVWNKTTMKQSVATIIIGTVTTFLSVILLIKKIKTLKNKGATKKEIFKHIILPIILIGIGITATVLGATKISQISMALTSTISKMEETIKGDTAALEKIKNSPDATEDIKELCNQRFQDSPFIRTISTGKKIDIYDINKVGNLLETDRMTILDAFSGTEFTTTLATLKSDLVKVNRLLVKNGRLEWGEFAQIIGMNAGTCSYYWFWNENDVLDGISYSFKPEISENGQITVTGYLSQDPETDWDTKGFDESFKEQNAMTDRTPSRNGKYIPSNYQEPEISEEDQQLYEQLERRNFGKKLRKEIQENYPGLLEV